MLRLFYFSGTGNARNVAHWIAAAWRERGRDVEVADLATVDPHAVRIGERDEVGLASPTHGFNFPPTTLRFVFGFPPAPGRNRVFILNTRGGVRLFGVAIPGLSGVTQLLAALVLLLKGYRVVGMRPIDLPSSWISLHPGLGEATIRALYARCAGVTARFAERMLDGRRDLRALWDLPQDLLLAPISLGYYLVGRFFFAKSFVATSACDRCNACVEQCPTGALRLVDGRPFWTWRCESCMRCINRCPKRAIETAHGFVAGFVLVFELALSLLVYRALRPLASMLPEAGPLSAVAGAALKSGLMVAALFLSYRLLHLSLRSRVIDRLVVLTSLTHFRFWRRYRPPH